MIFGESPRVLVQGITGRQAAFWTERMVQYGTEIVAGVTPGKVGQMVYGIPVYDTVQAASREHRVDAVLSLVPPLSVLSASLEALNSGIRLLVILVEHVPVHDVIHVLAEARERDVTVIGPNSPGIVMPGRYFVGILPAWAPNIFRPGQIGLVSRSGSLGTLVALELARAGFGQSAFVGIGGDPIVGTTFVDALQMFERDERTSAVVLIGEVGGPLEEAAATFIPTMTKPVVALVAGRAAPVGRRMGHAGAIVSNGRAAASEKIAMLKQAGAHVVNLASEIGSTLTQALGRMTDADAHVD